MNLERLKISQLPTRSIAFLLICAGGLLVFTLLVIYPQRLSLAEADLEIMKLKERIDEQRILNPVFQDLLRKVRLKDTEGLPFPKKAKFVHSESATIPSVFQDIAQKSHLTLQDITTDVDSLIENSEYLKIKFVVKGDFVDLRTFMLNLGDLPYLEQIERIQIQSTKDAKEVSFKVWLAQE
jgi:inhibitor of KinA sporulation pathway (predicted exonuclease)